MQLADAWDSILTRKAEEAPDGIAPLLPILQDQSAPPQTAMTDPLPEQIVITGKRIPPVRPAIQIPILKPVSIAVPDPWDRIMANRAAMPTQRPTGWQRYLPWAAGLLAVVAVAMLAAEKKRSQPSRRRR